ncbi:uncharacterized protein LOC119665893 [Teleopsis dalmanni]|uniref:uncharacterized protein LOC119665893 n=1 Tax=Teleopsis dalmanni TaxID=139649 RepID=UPI0018CD3A50|nr:uncharacterized protein LOC119665893 [Teleopsis dalmanni]
MSSGASLIPTTVPGNGNVSSSDIVPTAAATNTVERRCDNADCNVVKLVSMVPKRKNIQFVTEPTVSDKPLLINGFTTIFQVDGSSAKLSDLKIPSSTNPSVPKTIFRVVPNTHAHIVNYVVVDADGESLRKINDSDPATMRKLLDSQKNSADQMLRKLMAGHGSSVVVSTASNIADPVPVVSKSQTTIGTPVTSASRVPLASASIQPLSSRASNTAGYSTGTAQAQTQLKPSIQLPMRMHPNLKITAVASAETVSTLSTPTLSQAQPPTTSANLPLITPVPLANLQSAPQLPVKSSGSTASQVDKPVFDQMQAELEDLRRKVALLAEAQAKNQQVPSTQGGFARGVKRNY